MTTATNSSSSYSAAASTTTVSTQSSQKFAQAAKQSTEMTRENAIRKIATILEDNPHYEMDMAAFNRQGVALFGFDRVAFTYMCCWGAPEDVSVVPIPAYCDRARDGGTSSAKSIDGSLNFIWLAGCSAALINKETAETIDLKSLPEEEMKKIREERRKEDRDATNASGLTVVDKTNLAAQVTLMIDRTRQKGVPCFDVRLNKKILIYPTSSNASGDYSYRFSLCRSRSITFEPVQEGLVKMTEVDDKSTNVWHIDTSSALSGIAYDIHDHLPQERPLNAVLEQMRKTDIDYGQIEMGAFNKHGVALLSTQRSELNPKTHKTVTSRVLYYGSPQDAQLKQLKSVTEEPTNETRTKSSNRFVYFKRVKDVFSLNSSPAKSLSSELVSLTLEGLEKRISEATKSSTLNDTFSIRVIRIIAEFALSSAAIS